MPITLVGATAATAEGTYATTGSLTIDYPTGLQAGDVLHLVITIARPRYDELAWPQFVLAREYRYSPPPGWTIAYSGGPTNRNAVENFGIPHVMVLRRVALGNEPTSVTIPVSERVASHPEKEYNVALAGVMTAHRGVAQHLIFGPVVDGMTITAWTATSGSGGSSGTHYLPQADPFVYYPGSVGLQFAVQTARNTPEGTQLPPTNSPIPTDTPPPAEWVVDGEARTTALSDNVTTAVTAISGATPAGDKIPKWPRVGRATFRLVLTDATYGPPVDAAPQPGQRGVTGSGWALPEWTGRTHEIRNPLLTTFLAENAEGELEELLNPEDAPQPVGLEATFNGLGACLTATALFPAETGAVPYGHALAFALQATDTPEAPVTWWAGVVQNTRFENGLYAVQLGGFWSLLNDSRVRTEENPEDEDELLITRPEHNLIEDTLLISVGDPTTTTIEEPRDALQTWSEHLNNKFRHSPEAAWGVGPDQVFIAGLPQDGGVHTLDTNEDAFLRVTAGDFILPEPVTEWWGENADGDILTASTLAPALLQPLRIVNSRVDEHGNLISPAEAEHPVRLGPTHELVFAGICVPPLRVVNLPAGAAQLVASATVRITVGEEGTMPAVETTLTTVALPYPATRGGA